MAVQYVSCYSVECFDDEWAQLEQAARELEGIESLIAFLKDWRRCQLNCNDTHQFCVGPVPCMRHVAALGIAYTPRKRKGGA